MINQQLIDATISSTEEIRKYSHWYCESSKIDQNYLMGMQSDFVPNNLGSDDENYWMGFTSSHGIRADLIYYVQQNIRYYLIRENAGDQQVLAKVVKSDNDELIVKYENENGELDDIFNISIPNRKVNLQVSKRSLAAASKVFERMLNSEMIEARTSEMTIDNSDKCFELMIEYVHTGFLGIDKNSLEFKVEKEPITLDDLIGLLLIADEYQVESLTRSISKCCNIFNALTISLSSLDLSEDCKSIILEETIPIISTDISCVICDPIYRKVDKEELEENVDHYLSLSENEFKKEMTQNFPFLTENDFAPMMIEVTNKYPINKTIGKIPFEVLKGVLLNLLNDKKADLVIDLLVCWTLADCEMRLEEASKFLCEYVDFSSVRDDKWGLLFTVFVNVGREEFLAPIKNQLKDQLLKYLLVQKGIPKRILRLEEKNASIVKNNNKIHKKNGILIGLDAVGKTTFLYKWYFDEIVLTIPTQQYNQQILNPYRDVEFTIKDFGGCNNLWKDHVKDIDFVIFMVDASDAQRMSQAKDLLTSALELIPPTCPIIIYSNKHDLLSAATLVTVTNDLNLNAISDRKWFIQACCVLTGQGVFEGIDWLLTMFVPGKVDFFGDFSLEPLPHHSLPLDPFTE